MSIAVAHKHELLTHVGPEVDEIVANDLFRRKVDVFHWKAESPSCLCWGQRGPDKAEMASY